MTSAYGRTPMYGSQTPMYGSGSRTPMYGSQTPLHDGECPWAGGWGEAEVQGDGGCRGWGGPWGNLGDTRVEGTGVRGGLRAGPGRGRTLGDTEGTLQRSPGGNRAEVGLGTGSGGGLQGADIATSDPAGSRTPHYGSQTPLHDGSRTPAQSGAWDPNNPNTPSRWVQGVLRRDDPGSGSLATGVALVQGSLATGTAPVWGPRDGTAPVWGPWPRGLPRFGVPGPAPL